MSQDQHNHDEHAHLAGPEARKRIWIVFIVLSLITALEFYIAFAMDRTPLRNFIFIAMTLVKAAGIVAYFMHMRYERRGLSLSLFPILIVCVLALLMLLPDAVHAQCIMCKRSAEAQNAERARRMNQGILVLALPPVFIIGAILMRARRQMGG